MNEKEVIINLKKAKVVAVMRHTEPESIIDIVKSLKEGGINAIEITIEEKKGIESLKVVKDFFGKEIILGAGTIIAEKQAEIAINIGCDFIVTPIVSKGIISFANKQKCVIISGAMTPTEIHTAYEYGSDIIKVFPANTLGPEYFKDLKGPLKHIPLMPTGGINENNIKKYIENGAICVGVGSAIYQYKNNKEIIKKANVFKKLSNLSS